MAHRTYTSHYTLRLGAKGRLVLPAEVRKALGLRSGDKVILSVEPDGSLRLKTSQQIAKAFAGYFADLAPGVSLAQSLIQDRRAEAHRDTEQ